MTQFQNWFRFSDNSIPYSIQYKTDMWSDISYNIYIYIIIYPYSVSYNYQRIRSAVISATGIARWIVMQAHVLRLVVVIYHESHPCSSHKRSHGAELVLAASSPKLGAATFGLWKSRPAPVKATSIYCRAGGKTQRKCVSISLGPVVGWDDMDYLYTPCA